MRQVGAILDAPNADIALAPLEAHKAESQLGNFPAIVKIAKREYESPIKTSAPIEEFSTGLQQKVRDRIVAMSPKPTG